MKVHKSLVENDYWNNFKTLFTIKLYIQHQRKTRFDLILSSFLSQRQIKLDNQIRHENFLCLTYILICVFFDSIKMQNFRWSIAVTKIFVSSLSFHTKVKPCINHFFQNEFLMDSVQVHSYRKVIYSFCPIL